MRITDLLDKRSISLSEQPKSKNEALDLAVELMGKQAGVCKRGREHDGNRRGDCHSARKMRRGGPSGACGDGGKRRRGI